MPLLLPLSVLSLIISSWVDQVMLLRFYSKPPAYTKDLIEKAMNYLPFIILCSILYNIIGPLRDFFIHIVGVYSISTSSIDMNELTWLWFLCLVLISIFVLLLVFLMFGFLLPFEVKRKINKALSPKYFCHYLYSKSKFCCKQESQINTNGYSNDDDDDDRSHIVANDVAFTENCLKTLTKYEEDLYKFTDEEHRHDILRLSDGWEVCKHDDTGQLCKAVRWEKDGVSEITGEDHKKDDFKRMFEWISEKHLFSYHIEHNPRYKGAVFALNLQKKKVD